MKSMDLKEKIMLDHYQKILNDRRFDEYDILGFLIFIRRHLLEEFFCIREFADLIAHRERNRGIAMKAIKGAIQNDYQKEVGSTKILGYCGIDLEQWKTEWNRLLEMLEVEYSDILLLELSMCIFSLAQDTEYKSDEVNGKMKLFMFSNGNLSLCTTENLSARYVCFATIGPFESKRGELGFPICNPVETFRKDGVLHLREISGDIII